MDSEEIESKACAKGCAGLVHQGPAGVQQVTVWQQFQAGGETFDAPGRGRGFVPGRGGGESLCQGGVRPAEGNIQGQVGAEKESSEAVEGGREDVSDAEDRLSVTDMKGIKKPKGRQVERMVVV